MTNVEQTQARTNPQAPEGPRWLLPVLLTAAIALCALHLVGTPPSEVVEAPTAPDFPALSPQCPHVGAAARELAEQRELAAQRGWERASIDQKAASAARADIATAAACYRAVGDSVAADRGSELLRSYGVVMERELRHQELRLRIALDRADHAATLDSIAALRALLSDVPEGRYVRWLGSVERDAQALGGAR